MMKKAKALLMSLREFRKPDAVFIKAKMKLNALKMVMVLL